MKEKHKLKRSKESTIRVNREKPPQFISCERRRTMIELNAKANEQKIEEN
jgi:hypothetical protein